MTLPGPIVVGVIVLTCVEKKKNGAWIDIVVKMRRWECLFYVVVCFFSFVGWGRLHYAPEEIEKTFFHFKSLLIASEIPPHTASTSQLHKNVSKGSLKSFYQFSLFSLCLIHASLSRRGTILAKLKILNLCQNSSIFDVICSGFFDSFSSFLIWTSLDLESRVSPAWPQLVSVVRRLSLSITHTEEYLNPFPFQFKSLWSKLDNKFHLI